MRKPQHRMTLKKARKLVAPYGWHLAMPGDELTAKLRHLPIPLIERIHSAIVIIVNHELRECEMIVTRARARKTGQDV